MNNIVTIQGFKQRRLAKAEHDFYTYMTRADELQRDGKTLFAQKMVSKAAEVRKDLIKLRDELRTINGVKPLTSGSYSITITELRKELEISNGSDQGEVES